MSTLLLVSVCVFVCTGDLENGCLMIMMMMMMLCKTKYVQEEEEETDESEDEGARTRRGD
jgi:hypothetical protein